MDYRTSHVGKGEDYDEYLRSTPFDAYMAEHETRLLNEIVPKLVSGQVPVYLDFACGTGRITSQVEQYAQASYGVDISESMLEQARMRCKSTTFIHADMTNDDVDLPPVDLASSFRFFGNAQDELRISAFAVLNKVMRVGGHFITNNHRNPKALMNVFHRMSGGTDILDLTHGKFIDMARQAGFAVVQTHPIGLWIYRATLAEARFLEDPNYNRREVWSTRLSALAPLCPDTVFVLKKVA